METLTELFQKNQNRDDLGIHIFEMENYDISYAQFSKQVLRFLNALQARLSTKNVVLYCDSLYFFLKSFWALVLGRYVPVPLTTSMTDEHVNKLVKVFEKLDSPNILTDRATANKLFEHLSGNQKNEETIRSRIVLIEEIEEAQTETESNFTLPHPDDCAFIQFSSGSTGDPKGVVLSHRNLMTNIAAIVKDSKASEDSRSLSWMPLTHDMGLIGFHLSPYFMAIDHWLMAVSQFIRNPLSWLDRIQKFHITQTASPNFGLSYVLRALTRQPDKTWDLSCLRLIFCGAEPIAFDICQDFLRRLEPHRLKSTALFPVYGLAEASLAVSFPTPESSLVSIAVRRDFSLGKPVVEDEKLGQSFVSVGRPVDQCSYRLVVDGSEVPEDVIGEIQIKGRNVTKGYFRDEAKTQESFDRLDWFKTGDVGFIHQESLFVVGRLKDVFFVNGQNYLFFDVERVLEEVAEIGAGRCAIVSLPSRGSEKTVAFIVFKKSLEEFIPLYHTIQELVSRKFGFRLDEVLPILAIPRTTSGKVQRFKLIEAYLQGEYDAQVKSLERMLSSRQILDREFIRSEMKNLLERDFNIHLGWNDNFLESGIESIRLSEILTRTESMFSAKLSIADYFNFPNIDSLSYLIYGKKLAIGTVAIPEEKRIKVREQNALYQTRSVTLRRSDYFRVDGNRDVHEWERTILAFFSYMLKLTFDSKHIQTHVLIQKSISCLSVELGEVAQSEDLFSALDQAETEYELPLTVWARLSIENEFESVVALVCDRSNLPEVALFGPANLIMAYQLETATFEFTYRCNVFSNEDMANFLVTFAGGIEEFIRQTGGEKLEAHGS